ncbi:hypothetical protein CT19431_MP30141 [Cupriavidus taiwanensis]|nr:hypothetical protein CT19431_MP30141 [Cupriavidus taiwanensis]
MKWEVEHEIHGCFHICFAANINWGISQVRITSGGRSASASAAAAFRESSGGDRSGESP